MKEIVLKINGKKIYQFMVLDKEIELAKKLGISEQQYITEKAKIALSEKEERK